MSTNASGGDLPPKNAGTIRIDLEPAGENAPAPPPPIAPRTKSSGGLGIVIAVVAAVMACGVLGVGALTCAGVALFLFSSESTDSYEPHTVYAPPVEEPVDFSAYSEPVYDTPSFGYDGSTTYSGGYDSSYSTAPTTDYAPIVETTYETPSFDDVPATDNYARAAELESAIYVDEERLAELDGQLLLTGIVGGFGAIAAQEGQTVDDQAGGVILGAGANAVAQQLQSERDAIAIRLNANRTELARLRAAGY